MSPTKTASRPSGQRATKLVGNTQPRLFTPPLRPLTRKTTRGFEVVDFAQIIGEPLLPWQEWAVKHALELNPDGTYRFRTVLILVARQNGKSTLKRTVSLWRLYVDGAKNVLGTAQDMKQAREQWQLCLSTIRACPDLVNELETVRSTNGDEWFRLRGGGRYMIVAANDQAGRGLSIDELNLDELRTQTNWKAWSALSKTTMARPMAQSWCMSNAGSDESIVLNQLRDAALSGRDPSIGIFEWSAPDGCALDDVKAWQAANPALGVQVAESAIRSALGTDPPAIFRTEVLCQRVEQLDGAVDLGAWKACADPAGGMEGLQDRIVACFDMSPDKMHATLVAAARMPDSRVRVMVARAWKSSEAARAELPDLLGKMKPVSIVFYPTGPGGAFGPLLRGIDPSGRMEVVELSGNKVAEACQGLADLALARQVVQPADPLLDAHVAGAQKLASSDGWRFTRRGGGHCDAAYACAGAVYQAISMPEPARARIRVLAW